MGCVEMEEFVGRSFLFLVILHSHHILARAQQMLDPSGCVDVGQQCRVERDASSHTLFAELQPRRYLRYAQYTIINA